MPPKENKNQDTQQQDNSQAKPVVVETTVPVEQPVKSELVNPPIDTVPEIAPEFESITEQVESTQTEKPTEPLKTEKTQPQVAEKEPITPTAQSVEPQTQPQIQTQIVYKTVPDIIQKLLIKARAKIQERKQKKLDKIMTLFEAKSQITNKDTQKLLRTSRVSAFRYLNMLEKQNKIKQVGNTGKSVFYTKI